MSFNSPQTQNNNGLTVECIRAPDGKLSRKIERLDGNTDEYAYTFDNKGRLTNARLNGRPLESYRYNASGQRILQVCLHGGLRQNERQYRYNGNGALSQAGRTEFYYDRNGALGQRCDTGGSTFFEYGNGSRLDKVHRRDGWEIRYEYGPLAPQPIRRFRSGRLTHEYHWLDDSRLSACRDHNKDIEYQFIYDADGKLDRLRLVNLRQIDPQANAGMWGNPPAEDDAWGNPKPAGNAWGNSGSNQPADARKDPYGLLENCTWADSQPNTFMDWLCEEMARNNRKSPRSLFDESYAPREFLCCVDQVGTLRALVAPNGAVIKEIRRDSFGIPYHDSFPDFHLPIGFAGGLTDPDTGLVRFGWRDYDPAIGRFTALDPARDRRGDGDLYDYCMDDPVSRVDPTGLWSKENFDESRITRDDLGQFSSGIGDISGSAGGAGSGGRSGIGVAESSQATSAADHDYAPGTRIPRQAMQQAFEHDRDLRESLKAIPEQEELGLGEALVIGFGNIPESFIRLVCDLGQAVWNFDETIPGIGKILAGYGCRLFGVESDFQKFSGAMTQTLYDNYGTYENIKKTIARDPAALFADLSLVFTGGAGLARGGAKVGLKASRMLPAGGLAARGMESAAGVLGKVEAGMKSIGTKTDPLSLARKAAEKTGLDKYIPEFIRNNPKIGTAAARSKTPIGIAGSERSMERQRQEREQKKQGSKQ